MSALEIYRLICAFSVSSTTRSNDDAFGGALSRCSATNLSRLATSADEFFVQRLALVHLLVEFVHALLRLQRAQIVGQIIVLDGGEAGAAGA